MEEDDGRLKDDIEASGQFKCWCFQYSGETRKRRRRECVQCSTCHFVMPVGSSEREVWEVWASRFAPDKSPEDNRNLGNIALEVVIKALKLNVKSRA